MQQQDEQQDNISPRITRSKDDSALHYQEDPSKWRKKAWTAEEDEFLVKLVGKYGPQKWTIIAQKMPGRIGKQCRERWHNHLNPDISKDEWSHQQQWMLFILHKNLGNQWAHFTKYLKGRTDNSIKNHWNSAMKKKSAQYMEKYKKAKLKFQNQKLSEKDIDKQFLDKLSQQIAVPELQTEELILQQAKPDLISHIQSAVSIVQKKEEEQTLKTEQQERTVKKQRKQMEQGGTRIESATKSRRATPRQFSHHINTRLSQLSIFGAPSKENIVSAFSILDQPEPLELLPQPSFNDISLSIHCIEDLQGEKDDRKGSSRMLPEVDSLRLLSRGSFPLVRQQNSFGSDM